MRIQNKTVMKAIVYCYLCTSLLFVYPTLTSANPDIYEDDDDDYIAFDEGIADDPDEDDMMSAMLGHAKKGNPNTANSVQGGSDHIYSFMSVLFDDVKTHTTSHNETTMEVDFFDYDDESGKRNKRNTEEIADTAISFKSESFAARPNATDIKGAIYFDVRTDHDTSKNLFSEIRLFFKERKLHTIREFTLMVYDINRPKKYILIKEKKITKEISEREWISINVTKAVSKWFANPNTNHGLLLRAKNKRGKAVPLERVGLITTPSLSSKKQPFILSFLKSDDPSLLSDEIYRRIKASSRRKRDVDFTELVKDSKTKSLIRRARIKYKKPKVPKSRRKGCRTVSFTVDFEAINWHRWIIAPRNYASKRCEGSCSFPMHFKQNATSHALIQSLHSLMTGGSFPEPCCAPLEMSPLHVFMYDRFGNAVIKEHTNMVVDSCGCQ